MLDLVLKGLWETVYMTVGATVLSYIVGLPLGLILAATAADGVRPNRGVNLVLGAIVNVLRSVPFLILLYTVIPRDPLHRGHGDRHKGDPSCRSSSPPSPLWRGW